jgi:hypothetical protein
VPQALGANYADFVTYFAGVRRTLTLGSPYPLWELAGRFPLDLAAGGRGYVYPPTSIAFFLPFAGDEQMGLLFNLVGALLFVTVFLSILERRKPLRWWAVPIAMALALSPPLTEAIAVGQVTPWLAAAVGVAWILPATSGWLAVAGALIKIYPGAGLLWAWRKQEPIVAPIVAGLGVALCVQLAWPQAWPAFFEVLTNAEPSCPAWALPSIACTIPFGTVIGLVAALAIGLAALRVRRDDLAFLMLALIPVVAAPDLYTNYLLIPLISAMPLIESLRVRSRMLGSPT